MAFGILHEISQRRVTPNCCEDITRNPDKVTRMRISPKQFLQGLLLLAPITLLALASCGGGGGTTAAVAPSTAPIVSTPVAGCAAINLNWSAVAGATGYNVYETASGVTTTKTSATTSYTDTGLVAGSTYSYQVTATNTGGESPKSTPAVSATTKPTCTVMGGSIQDNTLSLSNAVSTLAGTAGKQGSSNGTGAAAQFSAPAGIATDGTYLYVADYGNKVIRKIAISTGEVTTISTTGLNGPKGITTDGSNLYVADTKSGTIFAINASGVQSTVSSGFSVPAAITFDGKNLYVANTGNNNIVQLATSGASSSVLPTTVLAPQGITSDGTNLYVTSGSYIAQITTGGTSTVLATVSGSNVPQGITTDGTNLYVSNTTDHTILMVPKTSVSPTTLLVAGSAGNPGSADGTGSAAQFRNPNGITTDGTNLYIVDTGNDTIRKIQ